MNSKIKYVVFLLLTFFATISFAQDKDLQLAQQYYMRGDYEKAVIYYEKVYKKDPNHANFTRYFQCLVQTKDDKTAEKIIKKQIKLEPDNLDNQFRYADFLEQQNREKEADQLYRNLIKTKSSNSMLTKDLYHAFLDMNKPTYARETLEAARKSFGSSFPLNIEFAELDYRDKDYSKMMDEYLSYIDYFPLKTEDVKNTLAEKIAENKENADFQEIVKKKLLQKSQKNNDDLLYSDLLIWYFTQRGDFSVALTQVKAMDKREKGQGKRVYELGLVCIQNGEYNVATQCFQYISNLPDSYLKNDAQRQLLEVRYTQITKEKEYDSTTVNAAINEYNKVIQSNNNKRTNYDLFYELANLYAYYGHQPQKAINILDDLLKTPGLTDIQQARAKMLLADIDVLTNQIWDASLLYMQIDRNFKYEPIGFEAKFKNARIFYYAGDFKFAQSQLDVLKQSTTKLIANDAMKLSVLITDNFGLDSNYQAMSMFARADLLMEQHAYKRAFQIYDSIMEVFPAHSLGDEIALRKAKAMMEMGNWDKAIEYLNVIVKFYSNDILIDDALYYLGDIYQNHKHDDQKALEYYKQLLFDHPASLYSEDARERIQKLRTKT